MSTAIRRHLRQQRPFRSLEEEVFVGLQMAADRLMAPWARYLREEADLSPAQYNMLRILRGAGPDGLSAGQVAERLVTRSPDVTRLVDRLEARRLVRRRRDPADRRAVRVQITDRGREQVTSLDAPAREMLAAALQGFGRDDLERLRDVLGEILDRVEPVD
jgi:DNA-binding MarR family transcriptional regulator